MTETDGKQTKGQVNPALFNVIPAGPFERKCHCGIKICHNGTFLLLLIAYYNYNNIN
jgi:hypothetical protein